MSACMFVTTSTPLGFRKLEAALKNVSMGKCSRTSVERTRSALPSTPRSEGLKASKMWKFNVGGAEVAVEAVEARRDSQRCLATESILSERSRAVMDLMGTLVVRDGKRSFAVLRPVPQPSSVIEIGVIEIGEEDESSWKAWSRSGGKRASSTA